MQSTDKPTEASAVELDESELDAVQGGLTSFKPTTAVAKAGAPRPGIVRRAGGQNVGRKK